MMINIIYLMRSTSKPTVVMRIFHHIAITSRATFREKLRYWALSFSIPHSALNVLLFILNNNQVSQLPKDSRTILQTNRTPVQTVAIGTGQFWYNGIKKCLVQHFRNTVPRVDNISLNNSIDGLPLHRSSSSQFLPILINIHEMPEVPVLKVAIFSGTSKPDDLELYLRPFVSELNELQDHGITLNRKRLKVRIRAVIADSPARAFIKGVVNFTGKHGCLQCTCVGEYDRRFHKTIFKGINAPRRTDTIFRECGYGAHHIRQTPY
uniref:Uncharacterized protein n=1 Tax=Anopheles atroparvus TaxID=41427 RepID=A0AAG5DQC3_ANOAO